MIALAAAVSHARTANPVWLDAGSMVSIATVDERYQSYNVEMA